MTLNLHLLRVFFAVAEQNGFSRAAEHLFISQSAVSKAVRELEQQLDLPLIERGVSGGKGIRLTQSGQALFEHARGIFALERAAVDDIRARVGLHRGSLTIGASTTIASYWLPQYIARFTLQFPDITPRILVGNTQAVSRDLLDCRIDLALVEGPVDDALISSRHWRDDELAVVASSSSLLHQRQRIDASHLNKLLWIVREPGSGTREATQQLLQAHAIDPVSSMEVGSGEAIVRMVAEGVGVAMLPKVLAEDLIALGKIRVLNLEDETGNRLEFTRSLHLLEMKNRPHSPATQAFLRILYPPHSIQHA
ncbi:LysR substrate-binding domain-containing protein [Undibacterium sp.]|jgi:DNA-binding transcriptional LysR family regulator|uniref:LysR substrate-binding domain-containing protein n=1 Tax=Undibacterium sp. TaxID=1914977 RepID=UPI002BFF9A73|nr:LysR substrate-binding domain-containing protein [Undibacterium sp.]HTD05139.1 LysR substrate-binding domain-containing protein [Undibacterium sp.]